MSGSPHYLPPYYMDSLQYSALLKHFTDRRLHPWIPEHKLFILGELAKLEVTDPSAAASFKEFYDKKMEHYEAEQKASEVQVEEALKDGDISVEDLQLILDKRKQNEEASQIEVVEEVKLFKKPGRKPKNS